jgi:hypothetical protein
MSPHDLAENPILTLVFGGQVNEAIRRRITYAFKVFCAVYGFIPGEVGGRPRLCYGLPASGPLDVPLSATYVPRMASEPSGPPVWVVFPPGGALHTEEAVKLPCFHPLGPGGPDWLGEIFEWISGAHEYSIGEQDIVGRIPFRATFHGRYGLDPAVPYAALAMHALNREIQSAAGNRWPGRPSRPWGGTSSFALAVTHDVDFLPTILRDSWKRYLKNLAIAIGHYRDPRLAWSIATAGLGWLFRGRQPLDCLKNVVRTEQELGIRSTCTILCRRAHPRDANYEIDDPGVRNLLRRLAQSGVEIAVHGSYTSLEGKGRLVEEYRRLTALGFRPAGGRQHWLRYRDPAALFEELCDAGAVYDCSAGYPCQPGFRQGACFPYPPYDFRREAPYPLLEVPLALMDVSLYRPGSSGQDARNVCERLLAIGRAYGWGGVSILWHDTVFGGAQIPGRLADLYWELRRPEDLWVSARELVEKVWPRYARAGLLPVAFQGLRSDPLPPGPAPLGAGQEQAAGRSLAAASRVA